MQRRGRFAQLFRKRIFTMLPEIVALCRLHRSATKCFCTLLILIAMLTGKILRVTCSIYIYKIVYMYTRRALAAFRGNADAGLCLEGNGGISVEKRDSRKRYRIASPYYRVASHRRQPSSYCLYFQAPCLSRICWPRRIFPLLACRGNFLYKSKRRK